MTIPPSVGFPFSILLSVIWSVQPQPKENTANCYTGGIVNTCQVNVCNNFEMGTLCVLMLIFHIL